MSHLHCSSPRSMVWPGQRCPQVAPTLCHTRWDPPTTFAWREREHSRAGEVFSQDYPITLSDDVQRRVHLLWGFWSTAARHIILDARLVCSRSGLLSQWEIFCVFDFLYPSFFHLRNMASTHSFSVPSALLKSIVVSSLLYSWYIFVELDNGQLQGSDVLWK